MGEVKADRDKVAGIPVSLIRKYNVPGPRYTSYPTVPYWDAEAFTTEGWREAMRRRFEGTGQTEGMGLYIHLPFCERLCTYCACNTRITVDHSVETPYIDSLIREWRMYLDIFGSTPLIRTVDLGGGTPTFFSPANLKKLMETILGSARVADDAILGVEGHPANTTREHLEVLAGLGFNRLSLGVQDFDPRVQKMINRFQSYEDVKRVMETARELGFDSINLDIIHGLPYQTLETIEDTIDKVCRLKPGRIAFYGYAHVPWIKPAQKMFPDESLLSDEKKRELYERGKELLSEHGYREVGMDHFALPDDPLIEAVHDGTLHRNFMGYTQAPTASVIGLGTSAISDAWTGFAQNVKVVEKYNEMTGNGELPIFKGHLLNTEDKIIRKHILQLMCHFSTTWTEKEAAQAPLGEALDRLGEMESDGLLETRPNGVDIMEHGRPFVRNACMAFDARLWRNKPERRIFSKTV